MCKAQGCRWLGTWAKWVEMLKDQIRLDWGERVWILPCRHGEPGKDSRRVAGRSNLYFKKIPWGNVDAKSHPTGLRPSRGVAQSTLKTAEPEP